MNERTHVDLFTGLAGFSLAAKANGVRTIAMCESDSRCQAFLAKAWPGVPVWPDVRTWNIRDCLQGFEREDQSRLSGRPGAETKRGNSLDGIWLLTAGVPCQPASRAGKQRGKDDDRWLWPAALRVFAEVRPAWAIFENPPGIGDVGLAGILSDLEAQNYAVRVFSLGACALGAPHRRMRYWIVCKRLADASSQGYSQRVLRPGISGQEGFRSERQTSDPGSKVGMGHAESEREQRRAMQTGGQAGTLNRSDRPVASGPWSNFVWLPCADGKVRRAPDDSFSLVDGLHRSVLGALGNSIVWPVAAELIKAMIQTEDEKP